MKFFLRYAEAGLNTGELTLFYAQLMDIFGITRSQQSSKTACSQSAASWTLFVRKKLFQFWALTKADNVPASFAGRTTGDVFFYGRWVS